MISANLKGKTALITGASSGLGAQFARCLSDAGARVILAARRLEKLEDLAQDLESALAIQMDVSNLESVRTAFQTLEGAGEKVDICINNAGIAKATPLFSDSDDDTFQEILSTNTLGVWHVTKAVAKHMKHHKIQGSIINIGSINGAAIPAQEATAYSVSKAAMSWLRSKAPISFVKRVGA